MTSRPPDTTFVLIPVILPWAGLFALLVMASYIDTRRNVQGASVLMWWTVTETCGTTIVNLN